MWSRRVINLGMERRRIVRYGRESLYHSMLYRHVENRLKIGSDNTLVYGGK